MKLTTSKLEMIPVSRLMDGRYFYIPSYQRGYRWDRDQVEALLDDLFLFANANRAKDEFYCLQPIVVKQVVNEEVLVKLREKFNNDDLTSEEEPETDSADIPTNTFIKNNRVWEVIDGQQRLTTLHIVFNYLADQQRYQDRSLLLKQQNLLSYSVEYETRPGSAEFLKTLASNNAATDIDAYFMRNAYDTIDNWVNIIAPQKYNTIIADILNMLWDLFLISKQSHPVIKVIWYEIDAKRQDTIEEFLKLNTGQIGLTDAELIKAMFLQNRGSSNEARIAQIALEWENIENTLSKDSFWSFLNHGTIEKSCRMEYILKLHMHVDSQSRGVEVDTTKHHYLLNYYSNLFQQNKVGDIVDFIQSLWDSIIEVFRNLQNWYEDPELYNYVGYLSQCKVPLNDIYDIYRNPAIISNEKFLEEIEVKIKETLNGLKVDEESETIQNKYGNGVIKKVLLLLNVDHLVVQIQSLRENEEQRDFMSPAYKFPFDLYQSQNWNVEHIDSATTNSMKDKQQKEYWISTALTDLNLVGDSICQGYMDRGELDELIIYLKGVAGEEEDIDKMEIGNLTLLDEKTNKSYGNSLFMQKRRIIFQNQLNGCFIPPCTQMVFAKTFQTKTSGLTQWNMTDKEEYSHFIYKRLKKFF